MFNIKKKKCISNCIGKKSDECIGYCKFTLNDKNEYCSLSKKYMMNKNDSCNIIKRTKKHILSNKTKYKKTIKSYRPSIDKYLIKTRNSSKYNIFDGILSCNNIQIIDDKILKRVLDPKIRLSNNKCVNYNHRDSINLFLDNLSKYKKIEPYVLIGPKQSLYNCWFNTGFIINYISDRGRIFNKYIRQYMITGEVPGLKKFKPRLHRTLFLYNIAIEATIEGSVIATQMNTNDIIKRIYNDIPKKYREENKFFINVKEMGHPFQYQKALLNYIHINGYKDCYVDGNDIFEEYEKNNYFLNNDKKDTLWVQILDKNSRHIKNRKRYLIDNYGNKFVLDSALVRDTHKTHFCCFITLNNEEYVYDGVMTPSIKKIEWKNDNILNKKNNIKLDKKIWDFMNGYQVLVYYRI